MSYKPVNHHPEVQGGMVTSTFSRDLESVIFAVLLFLLGGFVLFISCFFVTKCLQCYKARQRRLRRLAMGEESDDDSDNLEELDFEEDVPEKNQNIELVHL